MFDHLLSSVRIGSLDLKNRIVVAPMGVEIAEADGRVREPVLAYYAERARGGAGLIITENTSVGYPKGANSAHELGVSDDSFLPGLRALTEVVHAEGGRIAIQLAHHGKVARLDSQQGRDLIMPSVPEAHFRPTGPLDLTLDEMRAMGRAAGPGRPTIRSATDEDLEEIVVAFASAAQRAQSAGFDGVELHAAHGYIFSEFLSPAWNRRTDMYGGALENRARLLCDTLVACREAVGNDFPLWCRLDAQEFSQPGGIVFEEALRTARLAEKAGADAIHVSAYAPPLGAGFTEGPIVHTPGGYVDFAAQMKAQLSIPVIAVGRISPELGDSLIRDGQADLIAMGRPMLADPELPAKLERREPGSIRPCVYCYTCVAQPFFDRRVRCAVNPLTANENELSDRLKERARESKNVVIVGGGPAGLEAARIACLRGHKVTLFEQQSRLGGTLRLAALVYRPNEQLLDWFLETLSHSHVDIRLGQTMQVSDVVDCAADVVIIASGSGRESSAIKGSEKSHVFDGDSLRILLSGGADSSGRSELNLFPRALVAAGRFLGLLGTPARVRWLSRWYMPMGRKVVIVGGGLVGIELAEFLAERGRRVTVIEKSKVAASEMAHPRRWRALHDVRELGVTLVMEATVEEITDTKVLYERVLDNGQKERVWTEADTVIQTLGAIPNSELPDLVRAAGVEPICIGDCTGVGYIEGAIHDGFHAALSIGED